MRTVRLPAALPRRALAGALAALACAAAACGPSKPKAFVVDTTNLAARAALAPPDTSPPKDLTKADTAFAPALHVSLGTMARRASGLYVKDLVTGTGAVAAARHGVVVHYVGRLADGTVFDDSRKRGKPARFILGDEVVIKGWDEGIVGMRAGGKRRLVVPPALGYGLGGKPPAVPSAATLVFDIELVEAR